MDRHPGRTGDAEGQRQQSPADGVRREAVAAAVQREQEPADGEEQVLHDREGAGGQHQPDRDRPALNAVEGREHPLQGEREGERGQPCRVEGRGHEGRGTGALRPRQAHERRYDKRVMRGLRQRRHDDHHRKPPELVQADGARRDDPGQEAEAADEALVQDGEVGLASPQQAAQAMEGRGSAAGERTRHGARPRAAPPLLAASALSNVRRHLIPAVCNAVDPRLGQGLRAAFGSGQCEPAICNAERGS